jgi:hypothetical protein
LFVGAFVVLLSGGVATADDSTAAPLLLWRKSVEISWKSGWTSKNVKTGKIYPSKTQQEVADFYFSSVGRSFSRRKIWHLDDTGADEHGEILAGEAVDKERGGRITPFTQLIFHGNTLEAVRSVGSLGAIRLIVNFSDQFSSCTASAKYAKAGPSTFINPFDGTALEVVSKDAGTATCSVKPGNVFEQTN